MLRSVGAVVAGVILGGGVVFAVELLGGMLFPMPPGLDLNDPQALAVAMANAPLGALLFVLLAWAAGSLAGGWLAARLAGRAPHWHALIVGVLLLIAGIINLATLPHPLWFQVVSVLVFLPAAWLGGALGARQTGERMKPANV
jgi:hypothetical protein